MGKAKQASTFWRERTWLGWLASLRILLGYWVLTYGWQKLSGGFLHNRASHPRRPARPPRPPAPPPPRAAGGGRRSARRGAGGGGAPPKWGPQPIRHRD